MITKMTKYSFILLSADKEQFLNNLQELGVVDITRSVKPVDDKSTAMLDKISSLKTEIEQIEKGSDPHLVELLSERAVLEKEKAAVTPWGEFDPKSLEDLEKKGLKISFYSVPTKKFEPGWAEEYALQVINECNGVTYFTIVNADGFPLKALNAPQKSGSELDGEIAALDAKVEEYKNELAGRKKDIPGLRAQIAKISRNLDRYLAGVKGEDAAENMLCCFQGFAPVECDEKVKGALDKECVFYLAEEATKEDNPPIKLRNNRFNKMFETLTGMYGMPVYDEFDPTPVLSIFFMLFFAMCMGDAGYGLILILFGIAVNKKWVKIDMFKNIGSLISFLGGATLVVGLFLGTAFGMNLHEAAWVPQSLKNCMIVGKVGNYDIQMVLALGIGIFHICLAMIIKTACYIKRFGFKECISTCGWTLLIVGCIITISVSMLMAVPENITKIIILSIAGVSALGIFIFNKPGRNPLLNIGSGLWDTYNMVTGLLGDVLSYIRLYALGLAGGMLGGAFNDLAMMVLGAHPTWQWIAAIVILLFGHILNLLMSCLGAFVHPLRLTFVEYFKNSGFEGKGLKYNPLK